MDLEKELKELNIEITYSLKNLSNNEYYIIINRDNTEIKYLVVSGNVEELCSCISILLINKVSISIIKDKFNLIKTNNIILSIINKPKLNKPKKSYLVHKYSYFPKDSWGLLQLVNKLIEIRGYDCSLNDIDVSEINDMRYLFKDSNFNGDISRWNTSNVASMYCMFNDSNFNGDISRWNTSKVTNMEDMFEYSKFNQDISKWNVGNVINMNYMFRDSNFNSDISNWDVGNVKYMDNMFKNSPLEKNPPKWLKI